MKNSLPHVLVVGSSNTDLVIHCPRLPKAGETLLGGEFTQSAGGKGANQCVAAARAGAKVTFLGAHGADDFGRAAKIGLKREGINVSHFIERKEAPSGVALILVGGKNRQNVIAVARSANDTITADDVIAARTIFRKANVVVAPLEVPLAAVEAAARLAAEYSIPFILNPAPAQRLTSQLLRLVHVITPNEHEAADITGENRPAAAARRFRKLGCANVVVTLGARGALVVDDAGDRLVPSPQVTAVDTVGAGDCFTAWLGVGIAEGLSLDAAVQRAVRAAAISMTRPGAQAGMPYRNEVEPS